MAAEGLGWPYRDCYANLAFLPTGLERGKSHAEIMEEVATKMPSFLANLS